MEPAQLLDMLEPIIRQQFQGDRSGTDIVVVRVPEGIALLFKGGQHVLVTAAQVRLTV